MDFNNSFVNYSIQQMSEEDWEAAKAAYGRGLLPKTKWTKPLIIKRILEIINKLQASGYQIPINLHINLAEIPLPVLISLFLSIVDQCPSINPNIMTDFLDVDPQKLFSITDEDIESGIKKFRQEQKMKYLKRKQAKENPYFMVVRVRRYNSNGMLGYSWYAGIVKGDWLHYYERKNDPSSHKRIKINPKRVVFRREFKTAEDLLYWFPKYRGRFPLS